jgi:hypothetical protein
MEIEERRQRVINSQKLSAEETSGDALDFQLFRCANRLIIFSQPG